MDDKDLKIKALENMNAQKDQVIFQLNVEIVKAINSNSSLSGEQLKESENADT